MFQHNSPTFGPAFRSKLDLMGIRFGDTGGDGSGAGSDGGDGGAGGDGNDFKAIASQEELDRIVQARLAREQKKYEGFDDFKAKAAKWDELEDGKKTPDQKAIDEAYAKGSTETGAKLMRRLVATETKSIAASLGFNDSADALQVLGDDLPLKDDEPDTDAIKKLVEKLATDKPYLVKADGSRKPRTRPAPGDGDQAKDDDAHKGGKGKAAAALRQLAASRKSA